MLSVRQTEKPLPKQKESSSKMRNFRLYAFSFIAAGLMATTATSPAAAATKPIDVSDTARMISAKSPNGPSVPSTSYAGLAETNVSVGLATSGVPCGECIPACLVTISACLGRFSRFTKDRRLRFPRGSNRPSIPARAPLSLIMKQGNTVVASASYPFPGGCAAGYLYGVFFTVPVPTTTGFTTVIGTIRGGSNVSGANTFLNVQ